MAPALWDRRLTIIFDLSRPRFKGSTEIAASVPKGIGAQTCIRSSFLVPCTLVIPSDCLATTPVVDSPQVLAEQVLAPETE